MMNRKTPFIEKIAWFIIIAGVIGFVLMVTYDLGKEAANPCIEYSDYCDEHVYDDAVLKQCPCLKRKYE